MRCGSKPGLDFYCCQLPNIAIAGLIALGGLWVLNNVDLSGLKLPTGWQSSSVVALPYLHQVLDAGDRVDQLPNTSRPDGRCRKF
jgi:hypothetical protein